MISRIGYVVLEVPDLERAIGFYTIGVGARLVERSERVVYLASSAVHHEMVLTQSATGSPSFVALGLEVVAGSLGQAVEQAVQAGAKVIADGVGLVRVHAGATLETAFGFQVELFEGMEADAPSGRETGVQGPVRFEHINLATPDIDAWDEFLVKGLGLEWSDRCYDADGTLISWFHCPVSGADHHGIANTRSQAPMLHHIKWEYPTLDEVVDRVDRFAAQAETLVWGMGRHGVDRSIFAYVKDPAGVMNELGLGMLQVDDSTHWTAPRDLPVDTPQLVDFWGSPIPEPWLMAGLPTKSAASAVPVGEH
jgi:catechol 2,3-dioxygenase-like lactoylglutathione lyase family enzyme